MFLSRLVALNHERAAEEARGQVRWLRPEYQAAGRAESATALDIAEQGEATVATAGLTAAKPVKRTWPGSVSERIQALRAALAAQPGPVTAEALARQFNLRKPAVIADILDTLVDLGFVRRLAAGRYEAAH